MSNSGFINVPEAVGFGVLGATVGAVVCGVGSHDMANHAGLGMAIGAVLFIGLTRLPVRRAVRVLVRPRTVSLPNGRHLAPH